jgi:hypothetical protein
MEQVSLQNILISKSLWCISLSFQFAYYFIQRARVAQPVYELGTDWTIGVRGSIASGGWEFFSSLPGLGPTQTPIQWVAEVLSE